MKALLQPSLLRRLVITVVIALGVIWLALVAFEYAKERNQSDIRQGMGDFMRYEMEAFDQIATAPEARQFGLSLEREFNRSRREDGRPDVLMELSDRQGQYVFIMSPDHLLGRAGEVVPWNLDGRDYLVFRSDASRWTFQIAYPLLSFRDVTTRVGSIIGLRLLIAFPLIVLPIWFAVWRGLRPMRRLSEVVAARHADDLLPIAFHARHRELQPVVQSIDGLLSQLRQKIAREHAFVQDAAHELRTPMAVISAHVHVLGKARTDEERVDAEKYLDRAVARASHLIEQLLDLARLEAQPVRVAEQVDLAEVARQTLAEAAPHAHARDVDLSLHAPDVLTRTMALTPFKSILDNLLHNAIRYIECGGIVSVSLQYEAQGITLRVADDGPGISVEEHALVFQRFYRGRGLDASGAGLGLAIVWQATARLGGSVELGTGLNGRGCEFVVRIPA